jgi:Right handed beta helix region
MLVSGLAALLALGVGFPAVTESRAVVKRMEPRARGLPARLAPSRGQVYYVAPWGSNGSPGTRSRPWRTIQKALDTLRAGQVALVRAGIYRQSLVMRRAAFAKAPITVRAYPGERPVVRPGGSDEMDYPVRITAGAAYFRFAGFVVEGAPLHTTMNVWVSDGQRKQPYAAHDIEISGCEIRRGTGTGFFVSPNTDRVHVLGNFVHDNGDGSRQHQGIYFQGQNGLIANNVVYHHTDGFGIQVRGNYPDPDTEVQTPANNVIVTNNTVVDNSLSGIMVENNATNTTVVNNISAFNGSYGVRGYDNGESNVLRGNVAYNNLVFGNRSGPYGNESRPVIDFRRRNFVANPRFVDARRANFRLGSASPAVNRALPAFAPRIDLAGRGRFRRSRPDLGAFER